jgi:hypothetical protein
LGKNFEFFQKKEKKRVKALVGQREVPERKQQKEMAVESPVTAGHAPEFSLKKEI